MSLVLMRHSKYWISLPCLVYYDGDGSGIVSFTEYKMINCDILT